jgi:hypothetical protein
LPCAGPAASGLASVGASFQAQEEVGNMNRIIWLVGAVVIILFVLGFFGLR